MPKDKEIWKPIVTYEGHYEISNFGRVKSLERICKVGKKNKVKVVEKIMALMNHYGGYKLVWLRNGHKRKFFVHRLVAAAFIPNPMKYPIVNHKDRDKKNNHISNLEWMTFSENTLHYYATEKTIKSVAIARVANEPDEEFEDVLGHALSQL